MNVLKITKDGGPESTVWAYWLIEIKWLFSICLLRFENGSRDAYHSHAFNAVSWVLRGELREQVLNGERVFYLPSLLPIFTARERCHMVVSSGRSWVLSVRGPWARSWREYLPSTQRSINLTNGRRETAAGAHS
jgi:hypothetical protein